MRKRFMGSQRPPNWTPLWLAFLIPLGMIIILAVMGGWAPFGNKTVLTVDLGQQYIDFFANYRTALFGDLGKVFYDFGKGLGGNAFGDWAYYLFSPFNLLLLPFPNAWLPVGILLLIALKIATASWAFAYAIAKMKWQRGAMLPVFGLSYACIGWLAAYQFNVIWLDAVIFLPLIILGLEKSWDHPQQRWRYILPLAAIGCIHYYMAYMIGLFLLLYAAWRLTWTPTPWLDRLRQLGNFVLNSAIAVGLSAIVWLPTAFSLISSKGPTMLQDLKWELQYPPADFVGKFFLGTFNFEQMPEGLPNIFVGAFPLIIFVTLISNRDFRWPTKLATLAVTGFLIFSMMYAPLDILWHGFQFPVWYPYRFSFVFSFWLLWLAAATWTPALRLTKGQVIFLVSVLALSVGYLLYRNSVGPNKLTFVHPAQLVIGSIFMIAFIDLLSAQPKFIGRINLAHYLLLLLIGMEMMFSTFITINNLSYLKNSSYQLAIRNLEDITDKLPRQADDFYRVAQTFERTKGDPLQGRYAGGSSFSSAISRQQTDLMATFGQSEGDNFVNYVNGTLISDRFLSMRYLMSSSGAAKDLDGTPANTEILARPDLKGHTKLVDKNWATFLYQHNDSLPIAFPVAKQTLGKLPYRTDDPLANQNLLWSRMNNSSERPLSSQSFNRSTATNTTVPATVTGAYLKRQNPKKPATLDLYYTPTTNDPYYLTIGSALSDQAVEVKINGQAIQALPTHRHTIVLPLPAQTAGQEQHLQFNFREDTLWLQNVSLYKADAALVNQQTKQLNQEKFKVKNATTRQISGKIKMRPEAPVLMTSIPAQPGWHAVVDGQPAKTTLVGGYFLGLELPPGEHTVTFTFTPPYFKLGLLISTITALAWGAGRYLVRHARRRRQH